MLLKSSLRDVVAYVLDCDSEGGEFELQSNYYFHFRTNTLRKGMKFLKTPAIGWVVQVVFLLRWL